MIDDKTKLQVKFNIKMAEKSMKASQTDVTVLEILCQKYFKEYQTAEKSSC